MIKLSDYIVKRLAEFGVRDIFMISGGGAMHLVDSVGKNKKLKYYCPHHEQAAAMAAEGYARTAGKIAAVVVTSGPGGTNTLTGVIGQWLDSIPCLYLSGQVKFETTIAACPELKLRQLGDQEINIVDIVRPVTKYALMVTDPKSIRYHLEKALYLSTHGRPGPVWLDIPLNVQAAPVDEKNLKPYDPREDAAGLDKEKLKRQVAKVVARLQSAQRPVLLAGHGIRLAGAVKEFEKLIRRLDIPVVTAICGHDLVPSDHPLFFGRPGICGDRLGNFVAQNSDLLLTIGARLGVRQIGYSYETFAREAYKIMVDIDRDELKKPTLKIDLPIETDAKLFIEELLRQLGGARPARRNAWLDWCAKRRATVPSVLADNPANPKYVNSYVFADQLFKLLKAGDQVVTGNGTAYTSTFQAMKIKPGVRVLANQGCASMGYDLPAAIGACIARGKKQVVLITGDGSLQMNLQELQTIMTYKLPVKIFVLNNRGYLAIRATQDAYFDGRHVASGPAGGVVCPDVLKIGRAYGLKTMRLKTDKDLAAGLKKTLRAAGPVICEIMMDPKQTLLPKVSSAAGPDGRLVSRPLEDMFPFIDRKTLEKIMIVSPVGPATRTT
ncbi:MAG: thiamine pyrophosphate-binding protein [Candidatus Margulisbacteria bacterium]|nr:thiamine pyrophosphate-binding protein [Candidatus Margulisiibacteriota bacterium]